MGQRRKQAWVVGLVATALVLAMAGCSCTEEEPESATPPAPPPPPAAPPTPTAGVAPYQVAPGVPVWNDSYQAAYIADGDSSTAWYTPSGHALPVVMTLQLLTPATLVALDFDTQLGSYDTSGARTVAVEVLGPAGAPVSSVQASLHQGAVTTVPLPAPVAATSVRLTISANHGGSYTGLAGVALRTTPGAGQPPLPVVDRGLSYVPSGLPEWNTTYAAGQLTDANSSTHWFTPVNPTFPVQGTLSFPSPATITALVFDTRLGSYASSGAREVQVELLDASGQATHTQQATLAQGAVTPVALPAPTSASQVRLTIRSNHGGTYVGIADVTVQGTGTRF